MSSLPVLVEELEIAGEMQEDDEVQAIVEEHCEMLKLFATCAAVNESNEAGKLEPHYMEILFKFTSLSAKHKHERFEKISRKKSKPAP
jgi:hypothetical protein